MQRGIGAAAARMSASQKTLREQHSKRYRAGWAPGEGPDELLAKHGLELPPAPPPAAKRARIKVAVLLGSPGGVSTGMHRLHGNIAAHACDMSCLLAPAGLNTFLQPL